MYSVKLLFRVLAVVSVISIGAVTNGAQTNTGSPWADTASEQASSKTRAVTFWQGGTGNWSTGSNWDNGEPTSADWAYINNGGTAQITNAGEACLDLMLGSAPGETGTVDMSGGSLSLPVTHWETIGDSGTGTFLQSGGINSTPGGLHIGLGSGGTGAYELSGAGSLSADIESVGFDGTGTFTQSGGTNTVAFELYLGFNPGSSGTYTISAGELATHGFIVGDGGHGVLEITNPAAEISVSDVLLLGTDSALTAVPGATIHLTGGDFVNLSIDEVALAGLANLELVFEAGVAELDPLEVACEDKGATMAGYEANFALGKLTVGGVDVGMVHLDDSVDNGNQGGAGGIAEALYVDSLTLNAGSVLNLSSLHLYWRTEFIDNGGTILNGEVIQVVPNTITVCWDGSGDYTAIQEGIDAAIIGDEVVVCDGVYTGIYNKNLDFGGKAITVRSENGPDNCIIDCEGDGRGFYFHTGETNTSVVDGFTITNGYAGSGGGIYCDSDPIIINCTITGNLANFGGGIRCAHTNGATIVNCVITGNWAYNDGGAIYSYNSSPTITNSLISDNWAEYYGGAIHCEEQSGASISNCTISGNSANYGGGIFSHSSTATLSNSILWGNQPQEVYIHSGNAVAATYSDIQGDWPGDGNIDLDPLFVDPDGPDDDPYTWEDNDYRLSPFSPCIDAADNTAVPPDNADLDDDGNTSEATPLDLDFNPRFVNDPATPTTGVGSPEHPDPRIADMGAYEYLGEPVELEPPIPPAPPHDTRKNRYISIDATTNSYNEVAIQVVLSSMKRCSGDLRRSCAGDQDCPGVCDNNIDIECLDDSYCDGGSCVSSGPCVEHPDVCSVVGWVNYPFEPDYGCSNLYDCYECAATGADCDPDGFYPQFDCNGGADGPCLPSMSFANLTDEPVYRVWTEDTLHITDCQIVPGAVYELRAQSITGGRSDPLTVGTIAKPDVNYGDCLGPVDPVTGRFTQPDGLVGPLDLAGFDLAFAGYDLGYHTTWFDMYGVGSEDPPVCVPDQLLNALELSVLLPALFGEAYTESSCQYDPCSCPLGTCAPAPDCGFASCGDGNCDPDEDTCSCPQDCGQPASEEIPEATCTDGIDNDCDGDSDCADGDCLDFPSSFDPYCIPRGHVIEWVPMTSTSVFEVDGNEIIIPEGEAQVTLHLKVSGWDPPQEGNLTAGDFHAVVDVAGYSSGLGAPLKPFGYPNMAEEGGFVANRVCSPTLDFADADLFSNCDFHEDCPPSHPWCIDREDVLLRGQFGMAIRGQRPESLMLDYTWMSYVNRTDCAVDDGDPKYAGTLILDVPAEAAGTYTIGFLPGKQTMLYDCDHVPIPGGTLVPAQITVIPPPEPPDLPSDSDHQARKHRYLSIDPSTNAESEVAYKIELVEMTRCAGDLRRTCSVDADCPHVCDNDADITCTGDPACSGGTCVPTAPCVHHPDEELTWWVQGPEQELLGCRLPGG
ncbi:MAG: hypothetical protein JSU63_21505, partial [Phycisphaerales bacterium]